MACMLLAWSMAGAMNAAELTRLTGDNIADFAPTGPMADARVGDFVLRNDQIVAVIAGPNHKTVAKFTRPAPPGLAAFKLARVIEPPDDVPVGSVIDLALRNGGQDLLAWCLPWNGLTLGEPRLPEAPTTRPQQVAETAVLVGGTSASTLPPPDEMRADVIYDYRVSLSVPMSQPGGEIRYILEDGSNALTIECVVSGKEPGELAGVTTLVMGPTGSKPDRQYEHGAVGRCAWACDPWFGQGYVVARDAAARFEGEPWTIERNDATGAMIGVTVGRRDGVIDGKQAEVRSIRIAPMAHAFDARAFFSLVKDAPVARLAVVAREPEGPIADAEVAAFVGEERYATTRTGADGRADVPLPHGVYRVRVTPPQCEPQWIRANMTGGAAVTLDFPSGSCLKGEITDERGKPAPAVVTLVGVDRTPDPWLFPETGPELRGNSYVTGNGRFNIALAPGTYHAAIRAKPGAPVVAEQVVRIEPGRATIVHWRAIDSACDTPSGK